jgi:hypothetical protein
MGCDGSGCQVLRHANGLGIAIAQHAAVAALFHGAVTTP